jgi:hypothetical protein
MAKKRKAPSRKVRDTNDQHREILCRAFRKVAAAMNGPEAAEMIDPVAVVVVKDDDTEVYVYEKLQLIAAHANKEPVYWDRRRTRGNSLNPSTPGLHVTVGVASDMGTTYFCVPDPRKDPEWRDVV